MQWMQVFLAATRAGGIGINLTSARRCVILDELMNPVHNAQVRGTAALWLCCPGREAPQSGNNDCAVA